MNSNFSSRIFFKNWTHCRSGELHFSLFDHFALNVDSNGLFTLKRSIAGLSFILNAL